MPKTRVIVAAPDDDLVLTETIGSAKEIEHLATLELREEVIPAAQQLKPDVCLLSWDLPGETDILDIAYFLVKQGTRVVFMAGDLDGENPTVDMLRRMGVTDVIHGSPTAGLLIERLLNRGQPYTVPQKALVKPDEKLIVDRFAGEKETIPAKAREIGRSIKRLTRRKDDGVYENVIAVWSPAPAGKTFVAVNLAAAFALRGMETVLLDVHGSAWPLVGAPEGEDGLARFLETGALQGTAFCPDLVPGLYVLTTDPAGEGPAVDLNKVLEKIVGGGHQIIIDLNGSPLDATGTTVIVADHDVNHLLKIQKAVQEGDWLYKAVLVLNRHVESISVETVKQAANMNVAVLIPDLGPEALECQRAGVPAVLVNPAVAEAFDSLVDLLGG
ncbi:MAG: hypothetical protein K6U74_04255 [Firmicutes bacterium]|nr:hypothetical protein [Bacillota bacterium]